MAKKLVSFNFNGDFVPELEALSKSYPLSEVSTTYCTTAPARMKEYSTDTYLAEGIANYLGSIGMANSSLRLALSLRLVYLDLMTMDTKEQCSLWLCCRRSPKTQRLWDI